MLLNYCKDELGVGYEGMMLSESLFAVAIVVLDVPTGWISDVWKRKYALALGAALNVGGLLVLLSAKGLPGLILSQMIFGVGIALFNGTHTALLYDTLLSLGREDEYRRREGKRQALGLYGIAFAGVMGGFMYEQNHFLPILLSIASYTAVFIVAVFMREPERHKRTERHDPFGDIAKTMRYVLQGHQEVGLIILMAAALYCTTKNVMWTQQPYYIALHLPPLVQGALMSCGWLLGGLSSHMAHRLDGRVNNFRALLVALAVVFLFCMGAGIYLGYQGIFFLVVGGSCIYGAMSPRVNEIINRNVDSSRRATLLSTQTFLSSLFFIPVSNSVGLITDRTSIAPGLLANAAWVFVLTAALFLWKRGPALQMLKADAPATPHTH